LETINRCPLCNSSEFNPHQEVKDYTASNEVFQIVACKNCRFLTTNPRPSAVEISKYYQSDKYISHTGGGKSLFDRIYLFARNFSLQWKHDTVARYQEPGSLLDFGCGTGEFLNRCQKHGWKVSGVEPSDDARAKATQLIGKYMAATISELPETKYDAITLWHVLEHVHALADTLQTITGQLKTGGTIFIAVPNYQSPDGGHYQAHWAGYDVPRHLWHFSTETMTALLKKVGLKIVEIKPMKLDAFYVSLLSEGYRNPNKPKWLAATTAFIRGLRSNVAAAKTTNHSSLIYIAKHA